MHALLSQSSGDFIRSSISAIDSGLKIAKDGYDAAEPYLEKGYTLAAPVVSEAVKLSAEAAAPLLQAASPYVEVNGCEPSSSTHSQTLTPFRPALNPSSFAGHCEEHQRHFRRPQHLRGDRHGQPGRRDCNALCSAGRQLRFDHRPCAAGRVWPRCRRRLLSSSPSARSCRRLSEGLCWRGHPFSSAGLAERWQHSADRHPHAEGEGEQRSP